VETIGRAIFLVGMGRDDKDTVQMEDRIKMFYIRKTITDT